MKGFDLDALLINGGYKAGMRKETKDPPCHNPSRYEREHGQDLSETILFQTGRD